MFGEDGITTINVVILDDDELLENDDNLSDEPDALLNRVLIFFIYKVMIQLVATKIILIECQLR